MRHFYREARLSPSRASSRLPHLDKSLIPDAVQLRRTGRRRTVMIQMPTKTTLTIPQTMKMEEKPTIWTHIYYNHWAHGATITVVAERTGKTTTQGAQTRTLVLWTTRL